MFAGAETRRERVSNIHSGICKFRGRSNVPRCWRSTTWLAYNSKVEHRRCWTPRRAVLSAQISRRPWRNLRAESSGTEQIRETSTAREIYARDPMDLGKSSKLRMEKHPSRKSLFHGEFMRREYGTRALSRRPIHLCATHWSSSLVLTI